MRDESLANKLQRRARAHCLGVVLLGMAMGAVHPGCAVQLEAGAVIAPSNLQTRTGGTIDARAEVIGDWRTSGGLSLGLRTRLTPGWWQFGGGLTGIGRIQFGHNSPYFLDLRGGVCLDTNGLEGTDEYITDLSPSFEAAFLWMYDDPVYDGGGLLTVTAGVEWAGRFHYEDEGLVLLRIGYMTLFLP